jgi:ABC-type dipeptide/oligopeptide/nickel transport system permease subunit
VCKLNAASFTSWRCSCAPGGSYDGAEANWGVLIAEGAAQMETAPWLLIFPGSFLAISLFCFNFIGDGLRDALDPKHR